MTVRHREFKAKRKDTPPLEFTLEGVDFHCLPDIPGAVLTDFLGDATSDSPGRSAPALVNFITDVLVDEDVQPFLDVVHSKETVIEIELLGEIVTWLVEEYSGRPTVPPSRSPGGRQSSRAGSTGGSASRASRNGGTSRSAGD